MTVLADPSDVLFGVVSRALDALMDSDALPKERATVTDAAVLLLWALIDDYVEGSSKVAAESSALVEAFYNREDPVVAAIPADTLMAVRSTLNLLRQRKRIRHARGTEESPDAPQEDAAGDSGGSAGTRSS